MKYLGLLIFIVSLSSCKKKDTIWSSDWIAPIINDTLDLSNYINDSTFSVDSNQYLDIDLTRTLFNLGIQDFVKIEDTTINQTFNISIPSLNISPGVSIVNQIEEHDLNVDDLQLKKIQVANGKIKLKVFNPIETKVIFTVQLPGVTKNGILFEQQFEAPAGTNLNPGVVEDELDISGYLIDLRGPTGGSFNILQSKLIVYTDPNGSPVLIQNSDIFKVEANFQNVDVNYAQGYFGQKIIADTTDANIEVLSKIVAGSLDLPASAIQIEVSNGCKVAASIKVNEVKNLNANGTSISLINNQIGQSIFINPAVGAWNSLTPSLTTLSFNGTNSNIENYLENLGNINRLDYQFQLNPWGNTSGGYDEIFSTSRVVVKLKAQLPLKVGVNGLQIKDTFDFTLKNDVEKSHIEKADLLLRVDNAFPFNAAMKFQFLDENNQLLFEIQPTQKIESAFTGSIQTSSGLFVSANDLTVSLNEAQANLLSKVKFLSITGTFNSPNPATNVNESYQVHEKAFLSLKAKVKLTYKANI